MKKVLFILLGILCAVSAGATKYGTLYRGSGRGVIYTISSSHNSAASAGLAPAPVAAMGSVSRGAGSSRSREVSSTMGSISVAMPVAAPSKGIYTAATAVSGGVTTYDKAPKKPRGGVRKSDGDTPIWSGDPDATPCPSCIYDANGECIICGHSVYDELEEGHCGDCGTCTCNVPLEFNWSAMVFMAVMAVGYGVRASMREKCTMKENENRA